MNRIKTVFLLTCLTLLLVAMGNLIGGQSGMIVAFLIAGGMNFFTYWYSDKIVLKMYKAREFNEADHPDLYGMVKRLALQANMPMPKVYIIPSEGPNAFATGRNPKMQRWLQQRGSCVCSLRKNWKGLWLMNSLMSRIATL